MGPYLQRKEREGTFCQHQSSGAVTGDSDLAYETGVPAGA